MNSTVELDVDRVEASFELIQPQLNELAEVFYDELFTTHPQVRRLFEHVDLPSQRKKFGAMLTLIVTSLRRMDVLVSAVRVLGARHMQYGATREGYEWVVASLFTALEQIAGEAWDDLTEQAWREAMELVITQMIVGQYGDGDVGGLAGTNGGLGQTGLQSIEGESADEIDLLMEIASNPALSFNRDSLFTNYIEKKKLDYEMDLAKTVQQSLVPPELPMIDGYNFDARYKPAMHVGGDFYDWILQESGHLCLVVGDVSGKGVPGALIMSKLAGIVRAVLSCDHTVEDAMETINRHMCDRMPGGRFVTLAITRIHLATHRFSVAGAGHLPPVHWRGQGEASFLDIRKGGIPIGIDRDAAYSAIEGKLCEGEALLYYTDGINEAMGPDRRMYGTERLCAQAAATSDPTELVSSLMDDVHSFTQDRPQSDDITVFTVFREHEQETNGS